MNTRKIEEAMRLARALSGWSIPDILAARKCAAKIHRADEMQCNGDAYEDDAGRWVDRNGRPCRNPYGRAHETLDFLTQTYGWTWYHQSDPRGWSVYLLSPGVMASMKAQNYSVSSAYNMGVAL